MNNILNYVIKEKKQPQINIDRNIINIDKNINNWELIEFMHDLKTPIISIVGFLQLLEGNNREMRKIIDYRQLEDKINSSDESQESFSSNLSLDNILAENNEYIGEALENANSLLKQIGQIVCLKKIKCLENNFIKYSSPTKIVEKIIKILKPNIIQNNIHVVNKIPYNLYLKIEETDLEKIMTHLIENAIKYNYYGGFVEINGEIISKSQNQKELVIDVIDSGIGFSKEQLRKINSNYITNQLKQEIKLQKNYSFGMGLTIVKRLINQYNGKIIINSFVNRGTTIKLFFPICQFKVE